MAEELRGELVRLRLFAEDLDRVSAIQDYLGGLGVHASLGAVVSKAIDCYYGVLVKEGAVPPNL